MHTTHLITLALAAPTPFTNNFERAAENASINAIANAKDPNPVAVAKLLDLRKNGVKVPAGSLVRPAPPGKLEA